MVARKLGPPGCQCRCCRRGHARLCGRRDQSRSMLDDRSWPGVAVAPRDGTETTVAPLSNWPTGFSVACHRPAFGLVAAFFDQLAACCISRALLHKKISADGG